MSARPGRRFPGCLTGRSRLRGPVRCPVPGGAAAVAAGLSRARPRGGRAGS